LLIIHSVVEVALLCVFSGHAEPPGRKAESQYNRNRSCLDRMIMWLQ
jgi:hypothetical protein